MKAKDWDALAKDYHSEVISPFQKGVLNPLLGKLSKIRGSKNKVIADIGCGRGEVLDELASMFKTVHAMDFSSAMIQVAKEQCTKKNIRFYVKDMRYLSNFKRKFDVVVCVNSVIMPKIKDVKKALSSVSSTLKKGGLFYGIFPAMETILYQGFLIFEEQLKGRKEGNALRNTKRILERRKYNFVKGTFRDSGCEQKFYYEYELKIRLKDAGFNNITISKVLYPWGEECGDYEDFPGKPKMWDWFVSARKG